MDNKHIKIRIMNSIKIMQKVAFPGNETIGLVSDFPEVVEETKKLIKRRKKWSCRWWDTFIYKYLKCPYSVSLGQCLNYINTFEKPL